MPVGFKSIGPNQTQDVTTSPQTFSVTLPSGVITGDCLLCIIGFYISASPIGSGNTITYSIVQNTAGWVFVGQAVADNFPAGPLNQSPNVIQVYRLLATGSDTAPNFTLTFSGTGGTPFVSWDGYVLDYAGVSSTTQIDAYVGTTSGAAVATTLTNTFLTPTVSGDMLVIGAVADSGPILGPPFIVGSPTLTARANDTDLLAVSDIVQNNTLPTPTYSFSVNPSGADGQMVMFSLLLKAAVTTPQSLPPPFNVDPTVPSAAVVLDLNRQVFWPLQEFPWDNITTCATILENQSLTWLDWVPPFSTWPQIPYVSWNAIPTLASATMYLGTESGYIMRFFESPTDNQHPIAYNATWPLMALPDLTQNLKVSWMEFYFQQMAQGPGMSSLSLNEAMEVDLYGLLTPLDPNPLAFVSLAIQLSDSTSWYAPVEPGPFNPANIPVNWLKVVMQGAGNPTSGNFICVGGTLYINPDSKPDYQSSAGTPTR